MNLIWAANIQTMKKYKHAEYYEISYTERIIVKYSTQACRHSWNIQHRANLKKKYSRLNEIPIGKLQLPSSACSTNTLGMGQLTHSKTGLHNSNNDLFEIFLFIAIFLFALVNSSLGRPRWVFYEKPLTVELFQPEGQLSSILRQVVLQNNSQHKQLCKNSSKIVLHISTIFSIAQIHIDFLCIFLSSCPSIYKRRDNFFLGCRLEEIFPGMTNYSRLWYSHFFINTCLSQRKWKWILL